MSDDQPQPYHCFSWSASCAEIDISDTKGCEYINVYDTQWQLQPFTLEDPIPQNILKTATI